MAYSPRKKKKKQKQQKNNMSANFPVETGGPNFQYGKWSQTR